MMLKTPLKSQLGQGIGLMLCSSLFLSFGLLLTKWLTTSLALPLLIFLRFLIPGCLIWWACLITQSVNFKMSHLKLHLARAGFAVLSQYALFYFIQFGSVLEATLLFMTGPLFVPLIGKVVDGAKVKLYQKISILIGFVGVVFVLQPSNALINPHLLIGLAAGFLNACNQVTFHKISQKTSAHNASLVLFTLSSGIALLPLLFFWHQLITPTLEQHSFTLQQLLLLLGLAFAAISNQAFKGRAYAKVRKAVSLAPFLYTVILFSAILDWLVYQQLPNFMVCLGAVLILLSGLVVFLVRSYRFNSLIKEKAA